MPRKDALAKIIREEWTAKLDKTLKDRFDVETYTEWFSLSNPPAFATWRKDGKPLTAELHGYIHGYMAALNHVYIWNGRV